MNEIKNTQIRIPAELSEYIREKSAQMGITQNAFMIILMEQGKKVWEAKVNLLSEVR